MTSTPQISELLPLRPVKTSLLPLRKSSSPLQHLKPLDKVPGLTRKQKLFVEYKLRGMSDKESALKAGYSPSMAENACITIKKQAVVARELRRRIAAQFEGEELTTDELVNDLRSIKDANILDYGDKSEDGKAFTPNFNKITHEMGTAIEEISVDAYGRAKIKLVPKLAVIDQLARLKKMYAENKDAGVGEGKFTIQSLDQMVKNYVNNLTINVNQIESLPERKALQENTIEAEVIQQ